MITDWRASVSGPKRDPCLTSFFQVLKNLIKFTNLFLSSKELQQTVLCLHLVKKLITWSIIARSLVAVPYQPTISSFGCDFLWRSNILLAYSNSMATWKKVTKKFFYRRGTLYIELQKYQKLAWENRWHLAKLPLVSPPNDVWEMSTKIPYWWLVTTQICVVLLIGCATWIQPTPPNDVWETSAEIPYWWRVTTQIWVVLLIDLATWFNHPEARPRSG